MRQNSGAGAAPEGSTCQGGVHALVTGSRIGSREGMIVLRLAYARLGYAAAWAFSAGGFAASGGMMADREVAKALAGSFLAELPAEVVSELVASGERADYPAGTTIYQPGS